MWSHFIEYVNNTPIPNAIKKLHAYDYCHSSVAPYDSTLNDVTSDAPDQDTGDRGIEGVRRVSEGRLIGNKSEAVMMKLAKLLSQ